MNRDELVERAARVMWEAAWPHSPWESANDDDREPHWEDARAVVDALLPQVTTVEELEALPNNNTWLASAGVHPSKALRRALYWTGYDFDAFGPLTVVWQP